MSQIKLLHFKPRGIISRILNYWIYIYLIINNLFWSYIKDVCWATGHSNWILTSIYCLVMDVDDLIAHIPISCNFSRNIGIHIWRITYLSYQPIEAQIHWCNRTPVLHVSFWTQQYWQQYCLSLGGTARWLQLQPSSAWRRRRKRSKMFSLCTTRITARSSWDSSGF